MLARVAPRTQCTEEDLITAFINQGEAESGAAKEVDNRISSDGDSCSELAQWWGGAQQQQQQQKPRRKRSSSSKSSGEDACRNGKRENTDDADKTPDGKVSSSPPVRQCLVPSSSHRPATWRERSCWHRNREIVLSRQLCSGRLSRRHNGCLGSAKTCDCPTG